MNFKLNNSVTFILGLLVGGFGGLAAYQYNVFDFFNVSKPIVKSSYSIQEHKIPIDTIRHIKTRDIHVYFSPGDKCRYNIISTINTSKREVLVQAYSFTDNDICSSLIRAHKKGVAVQVILDKTQHNTEVYHRLINAGINVFIDSKVSIAHNKVIIIDGEVVITGSYNFSHAAEKRNAENLLIINNRNTAQLYRDNWYKRCRCSVHNSNYRHKKKVNNNILDKLRRRVAEK